MFFFRFMSIALIAGLGNPGPTYAQTRHNAGFLVVDALAAHWNLSWNIDQRFHCALARHRDLVTGQNVWLAKPLRYMNTSGATLGAWMRYQKISAEETLVVYDEIQIPVGAFKFSLRGSAGGHNGIADMLQHCGGEFPRLRMGIGPKPKETDMKDYVLGKFTPPEWVIYQKTNAEGVQACLTVVREGLPKAMNQFNRKPKPNLPENPEPTSPNHETGNQTNL